VTLVGGRTVYTGAEIFDGTGAPPRIADVAVHDGIIAEVGQGLDGDATVALTGHGLLPGFVDVHVHVTVSSVDPGVLLRTPATYRTLAAVRNLRLTLAAGITTARDADGADAGLRQGISDGLVPGPRLLVAITMISQTGGRGDYITASGVPLPAFGADRPPGVADGPDQMRRTARAIARAGADVLKIAVSGSPLDGGDPRRCQLRDDEIAEVAAEAAAAGLPVMAHAHSAAGAAMAVRHGVRSIEHGSDLDDATIAEMARRGTFLVPTLAAGRASGDAGYAARHLDAFRRARAAGVPVAMGSDAGVLPHGTNLDELTALVEAGMPELEALTAATATGAELLGLPDIGTIQPGRRADLVIVSGGPLPVRTLPRRIIAVMRDGRIVAGRLPS
jgi:imidazolonepropionase-like amidohydrolase